MCKQTQLKTMSKKCKKKIMQVFIISLVSELIHQWINPGHHHVNFLFIGNLKNLCFVSIHRRVAELQTFVYVAVLVPVGCGV